LALESNKRLAGDLVISFALLGIAQSLARALRTRNEHATLVNRHPKHITSRPEKKQLTILQVVFVFSSQRFLVLQSVF
jgi:hypothetical protein